MSYILGIDLGTSSVKTLLLDEGGRQVSLTQQNYTFENADNRYGLSKIQRIGGVQHA